MESQQLKQSSPETPKQKTILAKAGQMSLRKQKYPHKSTNDSHRQFQNKILQEINNDDDFRQLPNITTTYIPIDNTTQPTQPSTVENQRPKKQQPKKVLKMNQSEYENVAMKLKQNSQTIMSSISKKKYQKVRKFNLQGEEDLTGIEDIIGDIQRVMEQSLANSKAKPSFKKDTQLNHHSAKRHFQSKGIHKFGENNGFNKLQEMLLKYQINDTSAFNQQQQPIEVNLKDTVSYRRNKNQERKNRFKQYNQISNTIANNQSKPQEDKIFSPIKTFEQNKKHAQPIQKLQQIEKEQIGLSLQNIQIVEIDWFKLPLFLAPLTSEGTEVALRMKDYPDDQSFWIAINQSLPNQQQYKTYSIFNNESDAGIKKTKHLMSQEQFRQHWAEDWAYDIEEEEHKQLLCQLDFQWYRSLVQAIYSHSIEDILIKDIKYDSQTFSKALRAINGGPNNDKNIKSLHTLPLLATKNKLKFVQTLLNNFAKDKANKTNTKALFVGVIPNIGQSQSKQIFNQLKTNLKQMFVGGLYASDSSGASMGVVITKRQAVDCQVKKWEGGRVQLGSVQLIINESEGERGGDRIYLNRGKSKNSFIKLRVFRAGEDGIDLQVGQELYFGRRYHILLD